MLSWKKRAWIGWGILNILAWVPFLLLARMDGFPVEKGFIVPIVCSVLFSYIFYWHNVTRPLVRGNELIFGKVFLGVIPKYTRLQSGDVVEATVDVLIDTSDAENIPKKERSNLAKKAEKSVLTFVHGAKRLSGIHDRSFPIPGYGESFVCLVEYVVLKDKKGNDYKVKVKEQEVAKAIDAWFGPKVNMSFKVHTEFSSSNTVLLP